MKLPLLISVPHSGLALPRELEDLSILSVAEIVRDGDEQAAEIYGFLSELVSHFVDAEVARAFVDLNRSPEDFRKDGVVKTHTCWDVPVYEESLPEAIVETLLARYYEPYHQRLREIALSRRPELCLAVDCHTMAEFGPPIGPDQGVERPMVCLGSGDGACPPSWVERLKACFVSAFPGERVTVDDPFAGGYITRSHGREMPWVQLELSRTLRLPVERKRERVASALLDFCEGFDFATTVV